MTETTSQHVDISQFSATSLEVMANQATINIGAIGHVAHGKSTLVKAISGIKTVRFKSELERNITIKLGYANAKIYKCDNAKCPRPDCFKSFASNKPVQLPCKRPGCGGKLQLQRHVSFVDCPGHESLMSTMLSGAAVMDAAILMVAANEPCPQPQTAEHMGAIEIMKLQNVVIVQNKIDLVDQKSAETNYEQVKSFISGTIAEGSPIVPISAQFELNVDAVVEYLYRHIPVPMRDFNASPYMVIVRSFDVNKPGAEVDQLVGGVVGGSILRGTLNLDQAIEIRPGITFRDNQNGIVSKPIVTKIASLRAESNKLQFAVPGGLVGVGTILDPMLASKNRLVGQVLGSAGRMPSMYKEVVISYSLLQRLLGSNLEKCKQVKVKKLAKDEILQVNVGANKIAARVTAVKGDRAKLVLNKPACAERDEQISLSRKIDSQWRLVGWATIIQGKALSM
ncbi:eukaryotic translation initiation factor 2 subunit gamma [Coemansia sp. RSA 485]|nr:eukaryotic translation initiation factor 2 subunit gamma [Coemansia sp. RSA 485]